MKKLLLTISMMTAFSTPAFALVSDHFRCQFEIKDATSKAFSMQKHDFSIARKPMPRPTEDPNRTSEYTESSGHNYFVLHNGEGLFSASLTFNYSLAIKRNAAGAVDDAWQNICFDVAGSYCPDGDENCFGRLGACAASFGNPFDPVHGWARTRHQNGVAVFNPEEVGTKTAELTNYPDGKVQGIAKVRCEYLGTSL